MSLNDSEKSGGYLICTNCGGYYQLKAGESPSDFDSCECGGLLEYHQGLEEVYWETDETTVDSAEYADDRKLNILKDLSQSIEKEEKTLEEIKDGKWSLMDFVAEKRILDDVREQKKLVNELLDDEIIEGNLVTGTGVKTENFISQVREQRDMMAELDGRSSLNSRFLKTAVTILLIFIAICFVYFFFAIKLT